MPVFDTNILIDHLRGVEPAREALRATPRPRISIITWMEVMCGARSDGEVPVLEAFLAGFEVVPLDADIARAAALLRRERRLRLPDAVILATALVDGTTLVTRNTRDFSPDDPAVHVPYALAPPSGTETGR